VGAKDDLKAELARLVGEVADLLRLLQDGSFASSYQAFVTRYQPWYTKAIKLLAALAADRLAEFRSYYEPDPKRKTFESSTYTIQDFVKGFDAPQDRYTGKPRWDVFNNLRIYIFAQGEILGSLSSRIDGVLADIEATLAGELEDTTLEAARQLMRVNLRAAGTVAGVVLEEHLQRVAKGRDIKVKANAMLGELNETLRQAGAYDTPTWRRIQLLADLRTLCAHKKDSDPTKANVTDLIDGVNWAVKTVL
jgi:hypothetical protein